MGWLCVVTAVCCPVAAADRTLATTELRLFGIGLKTEPARQTVPKNIATVVSVYLHSPGGSAPLPGFADNAVVRGVLRGPAFPQPIELRAPLNTPLKLPPIPIAGLHSIDDIRLEAPDGTILLRGSPETAFVDVIDKLLVTQVTARALSAAEIRERGIVFDSSNFKAYNFTAAFALGGNEINISLPVVLPLLEEFEQQSLANIGLPTISPPSLPRIETIIPDTLKYQTQMPNLQVSGFLLHGQELQDRNLVVPPIPGIIVIPGDIGFLNQFFSVMLLVGNVAPEGSNLSVRGLSADLILPGGADNVLETPDDPLVMARTERGVWLRRQAVVQRGPDGKPGTADDVLSLSAGESGSAEYLVEGRREGDHIVEMAIEGTLEGLPVGPVLVRGRARGLVTVRDPDFTLTFAHPHTVEAGEIYTLDVTVTNTSVSSANFVNVSLFEPSLSGVTLVSAPTQNIETIAPGDSATVSFTLRSLLSGQVFAATLDADHGIRGRFRLKSSVGELGIAASPTSFVLPAESRLLPSTLRAAVVALLARAWAFATAPGAASNQLERFSKKIVFDRAIQAAHAGRRISLGEPLTDSVAQLLFDYLGSDIASLPGEMSAADRIWEENNIRGFDTLRRLSVRGDALAQAMGDSLAPIVGSSTADGHYALEQIWIDRPDHISIVVSAPSGSLPYDVALVDAEGRRTGGAREDGALHRAIPHADILPLGPGAAALVAAAPAAGGFTLLLSPKPDMAAGTPVTISVIAKEGTQSRQVVFGNLNPKEASPTVFSNGRFPVRLMFEGRSGTGGTPLPDMARNIDRRVPMLLGAVQQADADVLHCENDSALHPMGRVMALLFNTEIDLVSAKNPEAYSVDGNLVVDAAVQGDKRTVFLAVRRAIGPFIERTVSADGVLTADGTPVTANAVRIQPTVPETAAVLTGRVLEANGDPVPSATLTLSYYLECEEEAKWIGVSQFETDDAGRYAVDWVYRHLPTRMTAVEPAGQTFKQQRFGISRDGQRLNLDVVFVGRGRFAGVTRNLAGNPVEETALRVTSLTDGSLYGGRSNTQGLFNVGPIPVGNIYVEAVSTATFSRMSLSDRIDHAGQTVMRDITLLPLEIGTVTLKTADLKGRVYRGDGVTPVVGAPVIANYKGGQEGLVCDNGCTLGLAYTDTDGRYQLPGLYVGHYLLRSFDTATLQEGEVLTALTEGGSSANILLRGGLGTVRGTVVTAAGVPVAGAEVGGGLSLSTTNAQGQFELTDVPVGRRSIEAVSSALKTRGSAMVDVARSGEILNVVIVLEGRGRITGVVTDHEGTIQPRVTVFLYEASYNASLNGPGTWDATILAHQKTGADGRFTFDAVPLKEFSLSAFTPNFSDGNIRRITLSHPGQTAVADIRYLGKGRVQGRILGADGDTPLAGRVGLSQAEVVVLTDPESGIPPLGVGFQWVRNYQQTDSDISTGRYSFNNVWLGDVVVQAAGAFSTDPIEARGALTVPGQVLTLDLALKPTSEVVGTVFYPDGLSPVGSNVVVRFASNASRTVCEGESEFQTCKELNQGVQNTSVVTDSEGRFRFPIVNAGSFTLIAEDPQTGHRGTIMGAVRGGETADFAIRLKGKGHVVVRAIGSDAVTPIPGARVTLNHAEESFARSFIADANGIIEFRGGDAVPEGDFVVHVVDRRNGFQGREKGRVRFDGETVSVTAYIADAVGTVEGRVTRSDRLTAVPFAEVVAANSEGLIGISVADESGRFRLEAVPLGAVLLDTFDPATSRIGSGEGHIDFANQVVPMNVTELAVGSVLVSAFDEENLTPLRGWRATVNNQTPTGRRLPPLHSMTDASGAALFPGISEGTFNAGVAHPLIQGSAMAQGRIAREGQRVTMPLLVPMTRRLSGNVDGHVFLPTGEPAANAQIDVCDAHRCENNGDPLTIVADEKGAFRATNLELGRVTLRARSQVTKARGSASGDLRVSGETISVNVVMAAVVNLSGVVETNTGLPAANVAVTLNGAPSSGCEGACVQFTGSDGRFSFVDVPAERFYISAIDPITRLRGAISGLVNGQDHDDLRLVLEPSARLTGRVVFPSGASVPEAGIELHITQGAAAPRTFFLLSGPDGGFDYPAVPLGAYRLTILDSLRGGVAERRGEFLADIAFGDVVLDEAPPMVISFLPESGTSNLPLSAAFRITFSEPVDPASLNDAFTLSSSSDMPVVLTLSEGDTVVTATPITSLIDSTVYTLRVRQVRDRLGRAMPGPQTATYATIDNRPPSRISVSPALNATGVPSDAVVRLLYSEPLNDSVFVSTPIRVFSGSLPVPGRVDGILGQTGLVFTPLVPWSDSNLYRVEVQPVRDNVGNSESAGLIFSFTTTNRTPPNDVILSLSDNVAIQNAVVSATATSSRNDIAFVDFYAGEVLLASDNRAPFSVSFALTETIGAPGTQVVVSAWATNTSGVRSVTPATGHVFIQEDRPPMVAISTPIAGSRFGNGEFVLVSVDASDDTGVVRTSFRADTGRPGDASARTYSPPQTQAHQVFGFFVPLDTPPGATISISANAVDRMSRVASSSVSITVNDRSAPIVSVSGITTGQKVKAGDVLRVVISATDPSGVRSLSLNAEGILSGGGDHLFDPASAAVSVTFDVTVVTGATSGNIGSVRAVALDTEGNKGEAPTVTVSIADTTNPHVVLRSSSERLDMIAGGVVRLLVGADDNVGVTRIDLKSTGAFSFADAKAISPPLGSVERTFDVFVPASLTIGATATFEATAYDSTGNTAVSEALTLTAVGVPSVSLSPSFVVDAGSSATVVVSLSVAAPVGGVRIDFESEQGAIASFPVFVEIPEGATDSSFTIRGLTGGVALIEALVQGVPRAEISVSVRGGIIEGIVFDERLMPVPNVNVTISGGVMRSVVTDANGHYRVSGITGPTVILRALDSITHFRAAAQGSMSVNGYLQLNAVLVPAGAVTGRVLAADGVVTAGGGIQVRLYDPRDLINALDTVFTDDQGGFDFPLVSVGDYVIQGVAADGRQGRSVLSLTQAGQDVDVDVVFLGSGRLSGIVLDGGGLPVPNAQLTIENRFLFGTNYVQVNTDAEGKFLFAPAFIGSYVVQARDPITDRAAVVSGSINRHEENIEKEIRLAAYGTLRGIVLRADGVTPASNAEVRVGALTRLTDQNGRYEFAVLTLSNVSISVSHPATRGMGRGNAVLTTHGQVVEQNITLYPQGALTVTVLDHTGAPANGAAVSVSVTNTVAGDSIGGTTGTNGAVGFGSLLAGSAIVTVSRYGLSVSGNVVVPQDGLGSLELRLPTPPPPPVGQEPPPPSVIRGHVRTMDGNPVRAGRVNMFNGAFALIDLDGAYRFENLPPGSYILEATDVFEVVRTERRSITLSGAGGHEVIVDFVFVPMGLVTGRAILPNGASAANQDISFYSAHSLLGGFRTGRTNPAGIFEFGAVPLGDFTVRLRNAAQQLAGDAAGAIEREGQIVVANLPLTGNAVTLPFSLSDANGFVYDFHGDGRFSQGSSAVLANLPRMKLDFGSGEWIFPDHELGSLELGGRQAVVKHQINGLDIERRSFVSASGYFARRFETFRNTTTSSITLSVRLQGQTGADRIDSTSSGDREVDSADQWFVIDANTNADRWQPTARPSLAWIYASTGSLPVAPSFDAFSRTAQLEWNSVVIPAGSTISFLHFVAQAAHFIGARASAARLAMLPPEALFGLDAGELASIVNMNAPLDGLSAVAALPTSEGVVTGYVYEGDGVTPTPNAAVSLRTLHPLYSRTFNRITDGVGAFRFAGSPTSPLTADGYEIRATHPSGISSDWRADSFAPGKDVDVINPLLPTGFLVGSVLRHNGIAVNGGSVNLSSPFPNVNRSLSLNPDASFRFNGLPEGLSFTLTASVPHPQGTPLFGTATAAVSVGSTTVITAFIQPTGGLRGTVTRSSGARGVGAAVRLVRSGFERNTVTDTAGQFFFRDVPVGLFALSVSDPIRPVSIGQEVDIVVDQTLLVDLVLPPLSEGSIDVRFARGVAAPFVPISIFETAVPHLGFRSVGVTNAQGKLMIPDILAGTLTVRAAHPDNTAFVTEVPHQVTDGSSFSVSLTLPAVATVVGTVTTEDGAPLPGAPVSFVSADARTGTSGPLTDITGRYTRKGVGLGSLSVIVSDPTREVYGDETVFVGLDGEQKRVDIRAGRGASGLPVVRYDANAVPYHIGSNGAVLFFRSSNDDYPTASSRLGITAQGLTREFGGSTVGITEAEGREIAISETVAGLRVTRKIYVPASGYFSRHLDRFFNPSTASVTIDLSLRHRGTMLTLTERTVLTSDGDAQFEPASGDQWIVIDDAQDAVGSPGTELEFAL